MKTLKPRTGKIAGLLRWIAENHARQCAIRELCLLPGWRLRELGIERDRIPEIVDGLIARNRAEAVETTRRKRDPGTGRPLPGVPAAGPAV